MESMISNDADFMHVIQYNSKQSIYPKRDKLLCAYYCQVKSVSFNIICFRVLFWVQILCFFGDDILALRHAALSKYYNQIDCTHILI